MRARRVAGSVSGLGVSDHACWTYGSDDEYREFLAAALRFAADGMALGQRLLYVADRPEDEVLRALAPLGDLDTLRRRRALVVRRVADVYLGGGPVTDHAGQLAAYHRAVEEAIAEGFAGIRVVADVSGLVGNTASCDQLAAWELVADRYMAEPRPLAALCGYDRRLIGEGAAAMLACVHPVHHDGKATFALFADGDALCIEGEVDAFQAPLLERALRVVPDGDPLVLDMSELRFIDVAGTGVLAHHATVRARRGAGTHLRHARPLLRRMWSVLGFSDDESVRFA